jgi:RNA polymerase sigma-70 factor (ECF subfamily)
MKAHRDASIQFLSFTHGETEGFEYYFLLHSTGVRSYIESMVRKSDMAADVCQECYMLLWLSRHKLRDEDHLRNFLYAVAKNLSYHHLRTLQYAQAAEAGYINSQDADTEENPEQARNEQISALVQHIEDLPLKRRLTILYRFFRGWSVKKIAGFFGVAEQTTRNNENKGKIQLRNMMTPSAPAQPKKNIPSQ